MKERYGFRVAAISIAPPRAEDVLRHAMAVGVDDVLLLPALNAESRTTGHLLASTIERFSVKEEVLLVFCGWQSGDDDDDHRVASEIAAHLGYRFLPLVETIDAVDLNLLFLRVQRTPAELAEQEYIECPMPAVLGMLPTGIRLRYPTVPMRLAAAKAKIPVWEG